MQIEIEVTRFELNGNDVASVAVSWRSFEPGNGSATGTHVVSAEVKFEASADRVAAGVSVLSMALDEVVGKIAAEVGDQALTR